MRYKHKNTWESFPTLSRELNGILATLQTSEWTLIKICEEVVYSCYKKKDWNGMIRNKLRIRLKGDGLSGYIATYLDGNAEVAKKILNYSKMQLILFLTKVHMTNSFRMQLAAKKNPVQFAAYDILYYDGKDLTDKPLMERKAILSGKVSERYGLSISRYIEEKGIAFFNLAKAQDLEGIVAKKKDGLYHSGKRTSDTVCRKI